ncbi:MAG TPA: site-specific integrase [Bdellovibrionota bacterium]|nr:site-specific integrase [Bdellovibrionota bacterium]
MIAQRKNKPVPKPVYPGSKLVKEYLEFLRQDRGLVEATISCRQPPARDFLNAYPEYATPSRIGRVRPQMIHEYMIKTLRLFSRPKKKMWLTGVRDFFKFLYLQGYHNRNLANAVPTLISYSLDRIPRALSADVVERLLDVPDRRRPIGRRDYAILLLLATYGVRSIQVVHLRFRDLKWREGTIRFEAHKGGKPLFFPLEKPVAEALLNYIKKDRKEISHPQVFVKHQTGPTRGNPLGRELWNMVQRHLQKIGIRAPVPSRGPHSIRHAFATRLLAQRTPLKTIADLLGHRSLRSTFIYTKVDREQLRGLARPWPEVSHEE